MEGAELGRELRARRKAAGRTIASVAADAGLSVPYIANLENGRGNPTLAALTRLAEALGARLAVTLTEAEAEAGDGDGAERSGAGADDAHAAAARRLLATPRARAVVAELPGDDDQLLTALTAIGAATGREPTERDLDRLLDLLLLAATERTQPY
ncbi:helix-turn-helix domain-containing protein [Streptomyces hainanensis]|uniref:XRE family transcriptional regulator n=1 Tax=Streptomyces hainanensis TaxID=402648 RepID=A0A4R4STP2_9ACTN|nr:helix-turn-helix transcriptional regulator [Streptomyces hainanensis]TDC65652.1 XRE family transcriptional regulator [Streptomyces hainanensis]